MMVVGWDPSALIPAINGAIDAGIPVVLVDSDVPNSKRYSFIGTDWFDLGARALRFAAGVIAGLPPESVGRNVRVGRYFDVISNKYSNKK